MSIVLPEPRPEETLRSLLIRVARLNGCASPAHLLIRIARRQELVKKLIWTDQVQIDVAATLYGMSPYEISSRFQLMPFDSLLSEGSTSIFRQSPAWQRARIRVLRACEICTGNDLDQLGFSFFRRYHQATGVEVCAVHGSPLHSTHSRSNLPMDGLASTSIWWRDTTHAQSTLAFRYAAAVRSLMKRSSPVPLDRAYLSLNHLAREQNYNVIPDVGSGAVHGTLTRALRSRNDPDAVWAKSTLAECDGRLGQRRSDTQMEDAMTGRCTITGPYLVAAVLLTKTAQEAVEALVSPQVKGWTPDESPEILPATESLV